METSQEYGHVTLTSRFLNKVTEHDTREIREEDQVSELLRHVFTDKDAAELTRKRVEAVSYTAHWSYDLMTKYQQQRMRVPRTIHLMLDNHFFILKVTLMEYKNETYQAGINFFVLRPRDVLTVNYHVSPFDTEPPYPTKLLSLDFYEYANKFTVNVDKLVQCGDGLNSLKVVRYSGPATFVSFLSSDKRFMIRKIRELLALSSLTSSVFFNLLKLKLDNLKGLEPNHYSLSETYDQKV